jgi:UDP-N-acetyl-D-mannosaminuronic acid transferase (WecB/TagA/CpsF family)
MEWLFRLARQPWRIRRMAVLPLYALRVLRSTQ